MGRTIIYQRIVFITTLLLLGWAFFSCKKFSPKIEVPSYIVIDTISIRYQGNYTGSGPGTKFHKFTDMIIYVNNQNIGIYPLHSPIPILSEGKVEIKIRPVIKANGMAISRSDYPFMTFFSQTVTLIRGNTVPVVPEFDYYEQTNFHLVEDFESSGFGFTGDNPGDTTYTVQSAEKFEGNYAIKFWLYNDQVSSCIIKTINFFPIPYTKARNAYLEMHYKAEQEFEVGIMGEGPSSSGSTQADYRPAVFIKATEGEWKKMYVYLSESMSIAPFYANYTLFFRIKQPASGVRGNIYIDNIKILND